MNTAQIEAAHLDAEGYRRDENFKTMQAWRGYTYAIINLHGTSYIAMI